MLKSIPYTVEPIIIRMVVSSSVWETGVVFNVSESDFNKIVSALVTADSKSESEKLNEGVGQ